MIVRQKLFTDLVLITLVSLWFAHPVWAAPTRATTAQLEFFEKKIRPVLAGECYECHGAQKRKGGLRLDYRDGVLKGGDTGPAIVPGDAKKSLLIQAITHEHEEFKMPQKGVKLHDDTIKEFIAWVNMGAPDPRDEPPAAAAAASSWDATLAVRKTWWSFQPVKQPAVPTPKNAAWSQHPVDRFLLANLERSGLQPASWADKRTLIRRVTFALTGLPPTSDEATAYLADGSPDAFAKLVNRLLDSPQFGERWARHWMDLMRYAETHGSEGDPEIPQAWRYRDYLIRAFNADVPCDQLIREHIAGDLLPNPRLNRTEALNESILGIASLRFNEHGFQPVDTLDEQVKTVDNQIDVISKAFQGLTVACARCHDHKFDPVSQRDFYALFGVLASSRPAQVTVDTPEVMLKNRVELTALKGKIKSALASEWLTAVETIPTRLRGETAADLEARSLRKRVTELDVQLAMLKAAALDSVARQKESTSARAALAGASPADAPSARWSFDQDARDSIGSLHGELLGGAVVKNGRLVLDGKAAHVRTAPLPHDLREKTLEAWVSLANLEQSSGGVLTIESARGSVFDAIVFAEKEPRKWVNGSNNFRRSQKLAGVDEMATPGELIHLAVVYRADSSIAFYRNGIPYAPAFTPAGETGALQTFVAGDAHLLLGQRHTGGAKAFLAGEIEEARLYERALTAEQIAASFNAGPANAGVEELTKAMTPDQRGKFAALQSDLQQAQAQLKAHGAKQGRDAWHTELAEAARNPASPLHVWANLRDKRDSDFIHGWDELAGKLRATSENLEREMVEQFTVWWDLARDGAQWFKQGNGLPTEASAAGEFAIEPMGDRVLSGLYPAGFFTHTLSQKHAGLLTSPRFKIETDSLSVLAVGGKGAMVRVIVDNYPLNIGGIFQFTRLETDEPKWIRLDTSYRKGSWAYLEFGNHDDLTRPILAKDGQKPADGRSYFGAMKVVAHNGKDTPKRENPTSGLLFAGEPAKSAEELAAKYQGVLAKAIAAWSTGKLADAQGAFLDYFARRGLLPVSLNELKSVAPLVADYRRLENEVPLPRRAPGVMEGTICDAPFMPRGDHLKPGEPVPRGYLQVLGKVSAATSKQSGRLELANAIASPDNPLTSRVMVNRLWHHIFGRGLVSTVDNFGRLGDLPTHPELLDYLAAKFVEESWSAKRMIRFLVTSRAYQMSSEASAKAREADPGNDLLSHFRVRRLEAEAVRDSLLAVTGRLGPALYGPGVSIGDRTRRSLYLQVRRNSLSPFLEVFDAPKPFSTLGRRDTTNVPAQSLALLNDSFVIGLAGQWAKSLVGQAREATAEARIGRMFEAAFGRLPSAEELSDSQRHIAELAREHGVGGSEIMAGEAVWQGFAQSLFNLKEFIYLR
jgi:hypothetical protein